MYPNSIKIENQLKKSAIDLVHLAQKLGYVVKKKPINKNCEKKVINIVNLNQDRKSIESEKITENSESEDDDMGFGLFD